MCKPSQSKVIQALNSRTYFSNSPSIVCKRACRHTNPEEASSRLFPQLFQKEDKAEWPSSSFSTNQPLCSINKKGLSIYIYPAPVPRHQSVNRFDYLRLRCAGRIYCPKLFVRSIIFDCWTQLIMIRCLSVFVQHNFGKIPNSDMTSQKFNLRNLQSPELRTWLSARFIRQRHNEMASFRNHTHFQDKVALKPYSLCPTYSTSRLFLQLVLQSSNDVKQPKKIKRQQTIRPKPKRNN